MVPATLAHVHARSYDLRLALQGTCGRAMTLPFVPSGVIPATLVAFHEDYSIDEAESRRHVQDVAATDGLSAITINGHAAEVHALADDEQRHLLDITLEAVGDRLPVVAGLYADGSLRAARLARMLEEAGASALLVFPPNTMMMGGHLRPEMLTTHFRVIADACGLPLILFNYAPWTNLHSTPDGLLQTLDAVETIVAIKDWCNDPAQHARNVRTLAVLPRPVRVLTTHSAWLCQSLLSGCAGLLSGSGSVIAELHVALWRAVVAGNLAEAQRVEARIRPTAEVFYAPPFLDMHNRMKEALVLLGRQRRAVVRPPLVKLPEADVAQIAAALFEAGLLDDAPSRFAA